MTVISTEGHVDDAERKVERDLGAIGNELDHVVADVAEHTTTLEGLKADRQWITERFEAIERDLTEIPRVPAELATTISESVTNLAERMERLESRIGHEEEHTDPPEDEEEDDDGEPDAKGPSILDRLF